MSEAENHEEVVEESEENEGQSCKTGICGKMYFCPVCIVIGVVAVGYFLFQFFA